MFDLLALYPTPDPLASEEHADRFYNRDLPAETDGSLKRELCFLRTVNFLYDSIWHIEREGAVSEELSRRRDRTRIRRSA